MVQKNGKVELLRFIFSIIIILFHCHRTLDFGYWSYEGIKLTGFNLGYFGVEFFFLISGFFMGKSIYKKRQQVEAGEIEDFDLGKDSGRFVVRKYMSVFPYHVFSFFTLMIVRLFTREIFEEVDGVLQFFFESIPEFFFLQKFGFTYTNVDVIEWYISAMLIAVAIIYPIAFKFYSMFARIIAPVGGVWILGVLMYNYGTFSDHDRWLGFGYACVFRAIAEISLGISAFEFASVLSATKHSERAKIILTIIENFCFISVIIYSCTSVSKTYDVHMFIFLMIAVAFSFSGQTKGNELFQKKWIYFLGSMSFPIYLCQLIGMAIIYKYVKVPPAEVKTLLVIVITILLAFPCKYFGDKLKAYMTENVPFLNH